ncbi:MAG: hypothetical protein QGH73_17985 [Rhodospirillales bacterium]|nr:hypothetical protein [Rhodospirillales bacterium]MDP6644211.1 hypothetical protein [Rhodospirillales bacterium]MDP6843564.1 hypothetical protein [Rhodospirillales bacterium]
MFDIFSKKKGDKAKKGKAQSKAKSKAKAQKAKAGGAKKRSAKNKAARQSAAAESGSSQASPDSPPRGIILDDIPAAPKPRAKPLDAGERLEQAKAALQSDQMTGKLMPADRRKLIEQALAVHNVQSRLLDDLDDDTKQRLCALAMQKLNPGGKK